MVYDPKEIGRFSGCSHRCRAIAEPIFLGGRIPVAGDGYCAGRLSFENRPRFRREQFIPGQKPITVERNGEVIFKLITL